jgi:mono/diheme cytochrome c family protein
MINRIGKSKAWIALLLVALLTIPLIGWNALPRPASSDVLGDNRAVGNVELGQKLFMGNLHFQNGAPPCMGCHNVGQNGLLGGGAMGPDLTNVSTKRSQEEIASILANSGSTISPVMQPIFAEHPLTQSEQADLVAFLNASVGQPESNKELLVIGISLAGFVGVVVMLRFAYRNRLRGVRKTLVQKARAEI